VQKYQVQLKRGKNLRLRAARKQRRWSLAMAAEQIRVNLHTYARWEYGTQAPYPINLDRLCIVYGKSPEELGFAFLVVPAAQETHRQE